ncbi:MAG TPA: type II secretion system protein [Aquabacterium sp.]|nr:type II secretion system protein [Aquabacterium sp.]
MRRERGFTYLMLLWWTAISAVVLAALGQQWLLESRRQKEMELVFRGTQIREAIRHFYEQAPDGQPKRFPHDFEELLEDRRGGQVIHHLRRAWLDPMTNRPWGLIRDGQAIKGVFSTAKGKPLRAPEGVDRYTDWRFEQG